MKKIFIFFIVFITLFCNVSPKCIFADTNGFDVTLPDDEYLYDGDEKEYKIIPKVNHVQIEYIESTGEQAINTYVLASTYNGFEIDMAILTDNEWGHIIGGATSYGDSHWHDGIIFNALPVSMVELLINGSNYGSDDFHEKYSGFNKGTRYTISYIERIFNISGLIASSIDTHGSPIIDGINNWYLFATNYNGTMQDRSKMRLYGCKMYEGTTEVRNFIPVVVTKDLDSSYNFDTEATNIIPAGTVCLYDTVTKKYFLNIGTGSFIPGLKLNGETYKVLESLKSSGSHYFDTNYNATINTKWIIDYRFNSTSGSHLGGGLNENDKRFCIVNDSSQIGPNIIFGIGNTGPTVIPVNTNRHIYVLDGPNKRGLIDGKVEANTNSSVVSNTRLYLFGRNGYEVSPSHVADLYNSKIFENNNLAINYIPVKRDSDEKVGIYDLKNNSFFLDYGGNSFTAGNLDKPIGDDFCRIDKKTNAGEYVFYPLSNLANALYSGSSANFDISWKIIKAKLTPSFNAYRGLYNKQEHPLSLIETKNQNGNIVDSSKYTIKYFTDESHSSEISLDSINTDNNNFINVGTYKFFYVLTPTDTVNYEGSEGTITISVYQPRANIDSKKPYSIPNTGVR